MRKNQLINQAQHIFTASGLIRDHIFKAHADKSKKDFKDTKYRELTYRELTLVQHMTVMAIDENGPLTIKSLAAILGVSSPSASAMVDKLVEKGILTREQSQEDRRQVIVRISPEAAKKIERIKQIALRSIVDLVNKVGPETTRKWCEVLEEIRVVIKK
ncbi:MAG: MarR family transcriptional regulator [Deltaproteobacteria bacterium]|nr:MarR family transcriptional regulator [Deltaproteobacteria bacterium]